MGFIYIVDYLLAKLSTEEASGYLEMHSQILYTLLYTLHLLYIGGLTNTCTSKYIQINLFMLQRAW